MPNGTLVRIQDNGWMSATLMKDWPTKVWEVCPNGALLRSLLALNIFSGYLLASVREKLEELCSDLAVIPGSLTSVLHPLDVSLNKPFKDNVR